MATISPFPIPQPTGGVLREAAIDETLVPLDTVEFAMNLHFDRMGTATLRKGLTLVGSQITDGKAVIGMVNYRNNARTSFRQLAMVGTAVYAYAGSSWSSVRSGLTDGSKARFTNFLDLSYMVNGNGNEALQTYDGSSFGTTNVASLPAGDVIENYRSRIWVGDASDDKVYYSGVVSTSGTLSGGTDFIQVSPQDGEKITAIKRHPRALLVFKNDHIYRIFTVNATDPDPAIFRGTYSQESVVEGKDGISYHHPSGFYDFSFDGPQVEISRPIIDIVQAIPRSYYENVSGWADDDHKYWSIGDITLGGIQFSNVVVRRTVSTQTWTVYSYASEIRSAAPYDSGTAIVTLVGDDDGNVLQFDLGTADNGSAIFYDLVTHWMYFTEVRSTAKTLNEITALHENAGGGNLSYQINQDSENNWRPIGSLEDDLYTTGTVAARNFVRIRFRISGASSGSPFIFRGWEALSMMTEGVLSKK